MIPMFVLLPVPVVILLCGTWYTLRGLRSVIFVLHGNLKFLQLNRKRSSRLIDKLTSRIPLLIIDDTKKNTGLRQVSTSSFMISVNG